MAYRFHFCLLQHTQIHHSGNQIDVTCEILFFQSIERKTRFRKVSRPNVALIEFESEPTFPTFLSKTWPGRKGRAMTILAAKSSLLLWCCFYSNSKMSALLLVNGRRYDFGVNHGNVFQILRQFWLDKSVLFFILHQSERRIEYGVSPANCICLWFLFVEERLDFPRDKICDRWFSFTTLTPGLASK